MKRYRSYREPWTTPWKVFFDRLRRQDLNWLQWLWVCGILFSSLSICVYLIVNLLPLIVRTGVALVIAAFGIIGALISTSLTFWVWMEAKRKLKELSNKKPNLKLGLHSKFQEMLNRSQIKSPPGSKLLSVVEFFYSPRTVEEVFKPIVADWRTEYYEALKQNRTIKARWISLRYKYHFAAAMGMSKVYSLFRSILSTLFARK